MKSLENPTEGCLLFVDNQKALERVKKLKPAALLLAKKLAGRSAEITCPVLISPNVMYMCAFRKPILKKSRPQQL